MIRWSFGLDDLRLDHAEIGDRLGLPTSAIETIEARALSLLRADNGSDRLRRAA